ncbi:acyl-CoA thioesterase [Streptomyces lydicus]|uniref:acyl-CoA thioesterase n=1 Tax=Streptomyces lydicus TaxID=47763 RepID=UPI001011F191|nr:thioesterase family protein [Streptomyces lydicus]MCZ1006791.1 thioesterase family protein [Streptomyces lydicus]
MYQYTYACPLRWSDADAYGHVNNAQFLGYMEEARTRMFQEVVAASEGERRQNAFVVSRTTIDYRAPLHYSAEPVDVHVWVTKASAATFELAYEIRDSERLYVEATTKIVAYNLDSSSPRRLSDVERAFVARYISR